MIVNLGGDNQSCADDIPLLVSPILEAGFAPSAAGPRCASTEVRKFVLAPAATE